MQTSEQYRAALRSLKAADATVNEFGALDANSVAESINDLLSRYETIKRALLIAEKLMAEPSNGMIANGLEESLNIMSEYGVDDLTPFTDYPRPGVVTSRCFKAMVKKFLEELDNAGK